jgi:hypothetical protein
VTAVEVDIYRDPGLTDHAYAFYSSYDAQGQSSTIPYWNLNAGTAFWWQACLYCGETLGGCPQTRSFKTGSNGQILLPPSLLQPANGTHMGQPAVNTSWTTVAGAIEYQSFFYWPDGNQESTGPGTQNTVSNLPPGVGVNWWVQARNDYAWSADSAHWTFTTSSGALSSTARLPATQRECSLRQRGANGYDTLICAAR